LTLTSKSEVIWFVFAFLFFHEQSENAEEQWWLFCRQNGFLNCWN